MSAAMQAMGDPLVRLERDVAQWVRMGLGEPTPLAGAIDSTQPTFGLTLTAPDDLGIVAFTQNVVDVVGGALDAWVSRVQTQTRTVYDGSAITVAPSFQQVLLPMFYRGFVLPIFLAQGSTIRFEATSLSAGGSRRLSVLCEAYLWPGGGRLGRT